FRRDLQVYHLADPFMVVGQEMIERIQTLDQPLGIIEALDPEHHETSVKACHHLLDQRRAHVAAGQSLECARLDTDRKTANPGLLATHAHGRLAAGDLEYP